MLLIATECSESSVGIIAAWIAKPLKSSKLRAAGYDERQRTMEIEFVNGDVLRIQNGIAGALPATHGLAVAKQFFEDKIEESFSGKRIGKVSKSSAATDFDALFGDQTGDKSN